MPQRGLVSWLPTGVARARQHSCAGWSGPSIGCGVVATAKVLVARTTDDVSELFDLLLVV